MIKNIFIFQLYQRIIFKEIIKLKNVIEIILNLFQGKLFQQFLLQLLLLQLILLFNYIQHLKLKKLNLSGIAISI